MDLDAFTFAFRPFVKALLDWTALASAAPEVLVEVVDAEGLRREDWCFPWFLDASGHPVDHDGDVAEVVTFATLPDHLDALDEERRDRIERKRDEHTEEGPPAQLVLPMYDFGGGRVLLDANHRTAGLLLTGLDARIVVCAVAGPDDPAILAELTGARRARSGSSG